MKDQIEDYINSIKLSKRYSHNLFEEVDDWTFMGDGEGDFEELAHSASISTVGGYIKHCENQIELAKKYLEEEKGRIE